VGIARNRAIDRLRANAVRPAALDRPADAAPADPAGPGWPGDEQIDIRRALGLLPADQRELIEEAYFLGLTHSELAARHGLPLGTVKTRIRAGMQGLRAYLEGRFIEQ
jgi:RNA polymerase sigma-70 factor (ECF subfamily)